jgi:hypothetical protein
MIPFKETKDINHLQIILFKIKIRIKIMSWDNNKTILAIIKAIINQTIMHNNKILVLFKIYSNNIINSKCFITSLTKMLILELLILIHQIIIQIIK